MAVESGLADARGRATIEMIRRHEAALRRTARRYSLCAEDAEDAYQRALEIALTKAPTDRPHELIRWTQTVTKHEALAIRRNRERLLGNTPSRPNDDGPEDWLSLVPARGSGPGESVVQREAIARSREALRSLKPAELRALTLLAEGYSYAEISSITGFSATKVNRCLAEGRERLRLFLARSEAGELCAEIAPLLSSYCDGELDERQAEKVREHLRACGMCRASARSYRAAPEAAAALVPTLPLAGTVLDRLREAASWLRSQLPGGGSTGAQAGAAGAAPGTGAVAVAKVVAVCVGVGGAACVAAGVTPPAIIGAGHDDGPTAVERAAEVRRPAIRKAATPATRRRKSPEKPKQKRARASSAASAEAPAPAPEPTPAPEPAEAPEPTPPPAESAAPEPEPVEYEPPPPPPAAPEGGSAAGEFGP